MKRMQLFFRLGSWALIVTAVLHLVGHFASKPPPADDTEAELMRLLISYRKDYGGFERSTMDFLEGYSLTFAALTFLFGMTNLVMLGVLRGRAKGLRALTFMNVLLSAVLFALSWLYFVLPPLVAFGVCLLLFGLALAAGQYEAAWQKPSAANLAP